MIRSLVIFFLCVCPLVEVAAQADYKKFYDDDQLPAQRELFSKGYYSIVIQNAKFAIMRGQQSPEWRTLMMRSYAQLGEYDNAVILAEALLVQFNNDFVGSRQRDIHLVLPALLDIHEFFTQVGQSKNRKQIFEMINRAAAAYPVKGRESIDRVYLGKAALVLGADPATVLKNYYSPAKRVKKKGKTAPPGLVEAHQAAGELALDKSDYALASKEFTEALKYRANDPALRFGLAKSLLPSDYRKAFVEIEKILESYPNHIESRLVQAEYAINFEKYSEARGYLQLVHQVNPLQPDAWALLAVLAELEFNNQQQFDLARKNALQANPTNPAVDHLIGRVLSRNYRFKEGAESQQQALKFDANYLPAKLQLAMDYLRLGDEEKAWPLAKEVSKADAYNVLAYNLEILESEMADFATIRSEHFIVRIPRNEAEIYGDRVLDLLEQAHEKLCKKYEVSLERPTLVEFFPNAADFSIRTLGSLGGAGLLGVCFGSVVTMKSPGTTGANKNNWEAILWHEFAHVVTLNKTNNKMPRWLSEGISVFEEMEQQANWGQRMSKEYRFMILGQDALTPVSELSSSFRNPSNILFSYYQSMLVVRYIVDTYGFQALKNILTDLSKGVLINQAIERNTTTMAKLEQDFAGYARQLAESLGPGVDWSESGFDPKNVLDVATFSKRNPNNFAALQALAKLQIKAEDWQKAVVTADRLINLFPDYVEGIDNGYVLKSAAYRGLGDSENESKTLRILSSKSAEAYAAYTQLLTLDLAQENWAQLVANADRAMAVNPFLKSIHYCRGCANAELGNSEEAILSFEKLLSLKPTNPSEVRFRLADLYQEKDKGVAKRYLLDSLADSPRYLEAYQLLLQLEQVPIDQSTDRGDLFERIFGDSQ